MKRILASFCLAILLFGCATTGSRWSAQTSQAHMAALGALSAEALEREAMSVIGGGPSDYAPDAYVLYAFALDALDSADPELRQRGMNALMLAALEGEQVQSYQLRPRAGGPPLVQPATVRRGGLPEAQYRLYREWIGDPGRETQALLVLMEAALADYPPALEAWEAEERAGRFGREGER